MNGPDDEAKPSADRFKRVRAYWRDPHWIVRDGVLALIVGLLLLASQLYFEGQSAQRAERLARKATASAERLENLRFVRQYSSKVVLDRPFAALDLQDQTLEDLNLRNADFRRSILNRASFEGADLRDSSFSSAKLKGANLSLSNLRGAAFDGTDLRGADLSGADMRNSSLTNTDLRGADLEGVNFVGACYGGSTTIWPVGYRPPKSMASACGG